MKESIVTNSAKETMAFAKKIAKSLKPGSVLAFKGNLGAGKTTFIKGLAQGLGLKNTDEVKSPTFVLMHVYEAKIPIYHFDLYRLESPEEMESVGMDEFFADPGAISCVEWAERATGILPKDSIVIEMSLAGETSRKIKIRG